MEGTYEYNGEILKDFHRRQLRATWFECTNNVTSDATVIQNLFFNSYNQKNSIL